jgi:hypothetical protein
MDALVLSPRPLLEYQHGEYLKTLSGMCRVRPAMNSWALRMDSSVLNSAIASVIQDWAFISWPSPTPGPRERPCKSIADITRET